MAPQPRANINTKLNDVRDSSEASDEPGSFSGRGADRVQSVRRESSSVDPSKQPVDTQYSNGVQNQLSQVGNTYGTNGVNGYRSGMYGGSGYGTSSYNNGLYGGSGYGTSSYNSGMYGGSMYGGSMYGGSMYGGSMYGGGMYGSGLGGYGYGGRSGMYGGGYGMGPDGMGNQTSWLHSIQNFTSSLGYFTELLGMNTQVISFFLTNLMSFIEIAGMALASLQPYQEFPPGHPRHGEPIPTAEEERRRLTRVRVLRWAASLLIVYGGFKLLKLFSRRPVKRIQTIQYGHNSMAKSTDLTTAVSSNGTMAPIQPAHKVHERLTDSWEI